MKRPTRLDSDPTRSALMKAFAVLDAFGPDRGALSIRELADRSGVARSTVHRIVQELLRWGALERGPRGLQLGVKLFELGTLAPSSATIREACLPFAYHLHELSGLTVNVAVREGREIVYIEKITSRALRVPHSRLGGRLAVHATGLGKAILAFSPQPDIEAVLAGPLAALTPRTITDPDALRAELEQVRAAQVAYDVGESQPGLFCVAAPILDGRGSALAAVSVTGATELAQAQQFSGLVRTVALAIGRSLSPVRRAAGSAAHAQGSGALPTS